MKPPVVIRNAPVLCCLFVLNRFPELPKKFAAARAQKIAFKRDIMKISGHLVPGGISPVIETMTWFMLPRAEGDLGDRKSL